MSRDSDTKIKRIYSKHILSKRAARVFAVQFLYAHSMRSMLGMHDMQAMLYEALEHESEIDHSYAIKVVIGAIENRQSLEEKIQQYLSEEWRFNRLGKVIQAILITSVYEILFNRDIASSILINEYVEIAKLLNHEGEVGFINKVLDSISKSQIENL